MRCKCIQDQDTLRTQDDDSTMQRTQIPPLDAISHSSAEGAVMATIAAMAAVLSSTGICEYGNRTTHHQDTFGTSTESSSAGGWVCIVTSPLEDILPTPSEELQSAPSNEFGSTWASSGFARNDFKNRSTGGIAENRVRHTVWYWDRL